MKNKTTNMRPFTVSPIVQTTDMYGRQTLGFTVYCGEQLFRNVMRCFTDEDKDEVLASITEERRIIKENGDKTRS